MFMPISHVLLLFKNITTSAMHSNLLSFLNLATSCRCSAYATGSNLYLDLFLWDKDLEIWFSLLYLPLILVEWCLKLPASRGMLFKPTLKVKTLFWYERSNLLFSDLRCPGFKQKAGMGYCWINYNLYQFYKINYANVNWINNIFPLLFFL